MIEFLLLAAAALLAFANGANDNFKGFATVWGAELLTYRQALALASIATALGGVAAIILAQTLLKQFTGKGLVPDGVVADPAFITSVGFGAAATVLLATRVGLPISTTHGLIGGLVGAGSAISPGAVNLGNLWIGFMAPMLLSPVVAALLGAATSRAVERRRGRRDCVCLTSEVVAAAAAGGAVASRASLGIVVGNTLECARDEGTITKASLAGALDRLHVVSAAAICFARGVNDTPKLAALLFAAHVVDASTSMIAVALLMVAGGLVCSRRVADTMSRRLVRLDHDQGVAANVVTSGLILSASYLGFPVSTTHVSVGSIAGTGLGVGALDVRTLRTILLSWVGTLPLAAVVAFVSATWLF